MVIIDFSDTNKKALIRGFSKGITAPSMLFEKFSAPSFPEVAQVTYPMLSDEQAINSDWEKIGADFQRVIERHGSETNTTKK